MLGHSWYKLHHHFSDRLPRSCPTNLYIFGVRRACSVDWCGPIGGTSRSLACTATFHHSSSHNLPASLAIMSQNMSIFIDMYKYFQWCETVFGEDTSTFLTTAPSSDEIPPIWAAQSTAPLFLILKIYRSAGQLRGNRSEKWWWSLYQLWPNSAGGYSL